MLHLSLFLFFAGLAAFLWTLDRVLGVCTVVLGVALCLFYLGSTFVPLWIPQCPTSTPLVHHVRKGMLAVWVLVLQACLRALRLYEKTRDTFLSLLPPRWRSLGAAPQNYPILPLRFSPSQPPVPMSMRDRVYSMIYHCWTQQTDNATWLGMQERIDELDASALRWLMFDVSDSDAVAVAAQALGAIGPDSSLADRCRGFPDYPREFLITRSSAETSVAEAIRAQRSILWFQALGQGGFYWTSSLINVAETAASVLRRSQYPDAVALCPRPSTETSPNEANHNVSPSSGSTVLLIIRRHAQWELSSLLAYLSLCDFVEFADTDWNLVAGAFSEMDHLTFCYLRPTVVGRRPPQLSLADLLAQIFVVDCDVQDRRHITRAIYRLLAATKWYLSPLAMRESPFLLEFLATHAFEHKHNVDSFDGALCFLTLDHGLSTHAMTQRYLRALALTLHAAPLQSDFAATGHPSLWRVHFDIGWLSQTPENAVSTINTVLRPFASPSVDRSIWYLIRRFRLDRNSCHLAERLVTALCMAIRRGDIVAHERLLLIDSYFAEMSPYDIVKALATSPYDAPNGFKPTLTWNELRAVHLMQHCTELRSEWWLAVLDYAQHSGSEGERRMVLALQDELVRHGSCTTCPDELKLAPYKLNTW
ncbi:hypothetical protein EXIGLDRAFT_743897 [Exidia glandulosa HHB12029]|uniref:Uncharacterized protein n=1 Tax=Exidia glandulosa HHB12029 TaxID=1314781 RepID=A0A165QCG6_EXIGL|nr:hypothetical protein EXIGLDRAFT_743897 [Exidia glandulosa HHB12029]